MYCDFHDDGFGDDIPIIVDGGLVGEILMEDFTVKGKSCLMVLPLHSGLSNSQQALLVFQPSTPETLKVVLATNIAETGITIPDAVVWVPILIYSM